MSKRQLGIVALAVALLFAQGDSAAFSQKIDDGAAAHKSATEMHHMTETAIQHMTNGANAFAINLFKNEQTARSENNVLLSPASVSIALCMTYNGALGKTKEAMAKALGFESADASEINSYNAAILSDLKSVDPKVELDIANALWGDAYYHFQSNFLSLNDKYYHAHISLLDFNNPSSVKVINKWVSDNTKGRIPSILEKTQRNNMLILTNAIYFKGLWTSPFDKIYTHPDKFTLLSGKTVDIAMMTKSSLFNYMDQPDFQGIKIPYGNQKMSMYIFLPRKNTSLKAFVSTMSTQKWTTWMGKFRQGDVLLNMPRFKMEFKDDLVENLSRLGMGRAFAQGADFGSMIDKPVGASIKISQVIHKTCMDVDESGTVAAAATAVTMETGACRTPGPPPYIFTVDHPFVVALGDDQTGTILFLGAVVDPQ